MLNSRLSLCRYMCTYIVVREALVPCKFNTQERKEREYKAGIVVRLIEYSSPVHATMCGSSGGVDMSVLLFYLVPCVVGRRGSCTVRKEVVG